MKPKVRLKGFDEDWILATLKNIALVVKGEQINKTALSSIGRYYVLNGGIVPSGYTDSYNTEEDTISISEGGNSCGYVCYNSEKFWSGGHNYTLQNVSIDKKYLFAYLKGIENEIMKKRVGSGLPNIQKSALLNLTVAYPTNPKEQKAIGEFYSLLDGQIEFYTQQIYKLKQLKEASLISMFPQGDETTPRVRFKGFEGEWEKKKFSDLYNHVIQKNDMSFGTDKIISVANMYYISNALISEIDYLKTYNVFRLGDIAFEGNKSKIFAHGRFVENTIGDGIVSHVFEVFRPIMSNYDINFWKYAINNERLMGKLLIRCTKSSTMMTNLVSKDFLNETFLVPSYEEQCSIGTFFQTLDTQITLQEQRLEKLKQLKSACLDQMFV